MNWKIIHLDETDSTNRWLRDGTHAARFPLDTPIAVVADYQTAGRGCGTNSWESERGQNLTFSLLIHPEGIPAAQQFAISEWISIVLCDTLEKYIAQPVDIKWPNDIYVGGRKIAGILIENRLQGGVIKDSIIGVGLNVNQRKFLSDAPNPVSIYQLTGRDTDRETLLHDLLQGLEQIAPRAGANRSKYWSKLLQRLEEKEYQDQNGRFLATITGVEPDGRLVMTDSDGRERRYAFKEVQFVLR